jgi:hypothetical protein
MIQKSGNRFSDLIMPAVSVAALLALLALLARLMVRVLLLLAGLLTAALLLTRFLAWILALLAGVLVRIVLVAHDGISFVERMTNSRHRHWLQWNTVFLHELFIAPQTWRGRRPHAAPLPVAAFGSRC